MRPQPLPLETLLGMLSHGHKRWQENEAIRWEPSSDAIDVSLSAMYWRGFITALEQTIYGRIITRFGAGEKTPLAEEPAP